MMAATWKRIACPDALGRNALAAFGKVAGKGGLGARMLDCYLCTTEPALSVWLAFKHMSRKTAGAVMRMGGRVVEGARLESVYTVIPYRGFESHPIRQPAVFPIPDNSRKPSKSNTFKPILVLTLPVTLHSFPVIMVHKLVHKSGNEAAKVKNSKTAGGRRRLRVTKAAMALARHGERQAAQDRAGRLSRWRGRATRRLKSAGRLRTGSIRWPRSGARRSRRLPRSRNRFTN